MALDYSVRDPSAVNGLEDGSFVGIFVLDSDVGLRPPLNDRVCHPLYLLMANKPRV